MNFKIFIFGLFSGFGRGGTAHPQNVDYTEISQKQIFARKKKARGQTILRGGQINPATSVKQYHVLSVISIKSLPENVFSGVQEKFYERKKKKVEKG